MEKNEGLHTLSQTERDILYAATDVAGEDGEFVAHDLARHTLARDISHATYHRAFKSLLGKGFMKPARGFKTRKRRLHNGLGFWLFGSLIIRLVAQSFQRTQSV